jgi:outer membrane protein
MAMTRLKSFSYWLSAALMAGVLLLPVTVTAEETYTLDECIRKALEFSPQIKEVRQDVEIAKTRLDEAQGYQWPQINALGFAGPAPDAKGNQIESDYHSDEIEGLGPFGSIDITLIQPLYTFGKIGEKKKAATHGIEVDKSRVRQKATDVALQIKEYYYGLLFAEDGTRLVDEVDGYLISAIDRTEKLLEVESEFTTPMDLHKLQAFQGIIESYRQKAVKSRILAKEALRKTMGLPADHTLRIADDHLTPADIKIEELGYYVGESAKLRPEFTQLKEGLAAKEALAEAAVAEYYPDIFLGAFFSYAWAGDRDKVDNPWIYDRFNHTAGGAALGIRWSLDFGVTSAQVSRSRAEVHKLRQTGDYAETFIPLQVEQSYRELMEAKNNIEALFRSQKAARKWLVAASSNYDLGLGTSRDLADSLEAYGMTRMSYLQSIYNFNMAYANLEQASGLSVRAIADQY